MSCMNAEIPLVSLPKGESGTFMRVEGNSALCHRLVALGFRKGAAVTVEQHVSGGGRIVSVAGSRIALSREILSNTYVEKVKL